MAPVTKLPYSCVTDFTAFFKKYFSYNITVTNKLFMCCVYNLLDLLSLVVIHESKVKYGKIQEISSPTTEMVSTLENEVSQMHQTITSEILDKQEKEILIDMIKKVLDFCFTSPYMNEKSNYCRMLRFAYLFSIIGQEIDAMIKLVSRPDQNS